MKFKTSLAASALLCVIGGAAAANTVSMNETLDVLGEDMLFSFSGLTAGTNASVTIAPTDTGPTGILGLDLSGAFPGEDENFEVTFDSVSQGFFSCGGPSNNGSTAIAGATDNSNNFNDCVFSLTLNITDADFAAAVVDGQLDVGVLFGDDVSFTNHLDVVTTTLTYTQVAPVPLPAGLPLVLTGFAGFAFMRSRKNRKAAV